MSETYRAAVCAALDGPNSIEVRHLPRKPIGDQEVRIRVRSAGVNYPDLLMTTGDYQLKLDPPFVPGMEAAGEIVETGALVERWRVGQTVVAASHSGGFAEEIVAHERTLLPVPPSFSTEQAACFYIAARTAHHAIIQRGQVTDQDTVLVLGATGGVGLAALQIAKSIGAKVIAVGSDKDKLSIAKDLGADHVINYRDGDLVEQVRALVESGVSVVYDPVGGELSESARRLIAWGGRYLIVGFASGQIPSFPANHAILKGYSLIGVRAGEAARRDPASMKDTISFLMKHAASRVITPFISKTFELQNVGHALQALSDRKAIGRFVVQIEGDASDE